MVFQRGEVRQVGIEVINKLNQDFSIDIAEYEILNINSEIVESGTPMIHEHNIYMLFNANEIGRYLVYFKYHIGSEIIKAKILVEVK